MQVDSTIESKPPTLPPNNTQSAESKPPAHPTKKSKPQATKKTLEEVLNLIPKLQDVIFDPLPIPNTRNAQLRIPNGVDLMDPYAL
jgi:hypothetical protein